MMGNGDIKADPYIEWIKQCMKDDKPYDQMVRDLLTAEGKIWDNPATGYLISDSGNEALQCLQHLYDFPGNGDHLCPVSRPSL